MNGAVLGLLLYATPSPATTQPIRPEMQCEARALADLVYRGRQRLQKLFNPSLAVDAGYPRGERIGPGCVLARFTVDANGKAGAPEVIVTSSESMLKLLAKVLRSSQWKSGESEDVVLLLRMQETD